MSSCPGFDKTQRRRSVEQLALDLEAEPRFGEEDFLCSSSNCAASTLIQRWPDWADRSLLLLGPPGSGKSHLCAIWARRAHALRLEPNAIPALEDLSHGAGDAYVLDDADAASDETAFFHFLNFVRESGAFLLMSARRAPSAFVTLPDLLSRLRRAPLTEIGAPDDELMRAVLSKLFRDRQLDVDAALIDYVALRIERSLDAARAFVRAIDRLSLARGRRVTRAFAAEALAAFERS